MGIVEAKEYFRTRLKLQGYKEVYDEPFNVDGVPDNFEDGSFNINIGSVSQSAISNIDIQLAVPVTINLYFKSRREVQDNLDSKIYPLSETILADLMSINNRSGSVVKNLTLNSLDILPYETDDNERSIRLSLVFEALIYICLD